ncbi:hypothetical protein RclHR1_14670001 [Rhizophagus clarus]|uniref:F-box domain-containing protein n=1 Tax=Rhizophagus clarus TaxID=94130 RepID=A0A2Z6R5S4_9GLOM|nr:hypothetical protein RclHR1_14670001 [Rhizophagus clarus]GET03481.1 hypothetical protein GLOIN_2v1784886 [Rhizophagus clarus]
MACSKLFSGDLPELINEVIQYSRYDFKTLHSYILVNRLWCRLAIPLLWENPFKKVFNNHHFIENYLRNLNEYDKTKLNEYVTICDDTIPLFNYPSFIRCLNTTTVLFSVKRWIASIETSTTKEQHSSYFIRNTDLSVQIFSFTKLIYMLLFQIFIENNINLHIFEVVIYRGDIVYFNDAFELILQNPNFIYKIKVLKLYVNENTESLTRFFNFLHFNCNSISSLYFYFTYYPTIEKSLSQIIGSQENLRKISFTHSNHSLYQPLLSLKNPSCSNTLDTIIFYNIDFKNMNILGEVFNQLNVLESVHIIYCYSLDSKFIQQINNITKSFKLKSLFLSQISYIESLKFLIQKSGYYLENFGITNKMSKQILPLIINYCSKLKYLGSIHLDKQSIYLLFDLIRNFAQSLNYLIIDIFNNKSHFCSIALCNLGQILPSKLEYLDLRLRANTSDFEIFFKNSQNIFIKKLLIKNVKHEESENIYPFIEEHIIKKKRVKYLAVLEYFRENIEELFSLKDRVKEFQLHNIQILNYNDLLIDPYYFIEENC